VILKFSLKVFRSIFEDEMSTPTPEDDDNYVAGKLTEWGLEEYIEVFQRKYKSLSYQFFATSQLFA
jgi:hypothetical protein